MDSENKKYSKKKLIEIQNFIKDKYFTFKNIIQQTMISANHYKSLNIISSSNLSICNDCLELLFKKLKTIDYKNISAENFNSKLEILQTINNDLSSVFKKYGTHTLTDFMEICLDKNYIESNVPQQQQQQDHVNLLLKFFQPINYKSILWSNIPDDINNESPLMEDFVLAKNSTNFQCFSVYNSDIFKLECCGIKLVIHNKSKKRTLIVNGFINEISPLCIDNLFIDEKIGELYSSNIEGMDTNSIERYVMSLSLKDLLINTSMELMINLNKMTDSIKVYKSRSLMSIVKQFNKSSIMEKRRIIIELLIFKHECDFEYIAYLLYDMLTTDSNNNIDSRDQSLIYDSLPINFKKYFKEAMNNTLAYTEELYNFSNNVPLEQQICLMKVSDSVKEKAMVKLKEIKSKSDDSGSKARQYLEGLLRIPFNQYIKEEIMEHVPNSISKYNKISSLIGSHVDVDYKLDTIGTFIQLKNNIQTISKIRDNCDQYYYHLVIKHLSTGKKSDLIKSINHINQFFKQNHIQGKQLSYSGKTNSAIKTMISSTIKTIFKNEKLWRVFHSTVANELFKESEIIQSSVNDIKSNCTSINSYMQDITATLDESVYGHEKAKQQIKRIIGQWITGENNGYCFGFEGPPGVGKTSLAKYGISNCLKNTDGCSRPFSFIAIGGSSNGSTFEGHNYTYVGSTWGKIVDILMESKCMNPIILLMS